MEEMESIPSERRRIIRRGILAILLMALVPPRRGGGYQVVFLNDGSLDFARLFVQWVVVLCFVTWRMLAKSRPAPEPYRPSRLRVWAARLKFWLSSLYDSEPLNARDWKTIRFSFVVKR